MNFWQKLAKPFVGLAPMDGVTDPAFRYMVAKISQPDLVMTEFVPADAVIRGVDKTLFHLAYSKEERPVVGQIFGSDKRAIYEAAVIVAALGFDGLDINMGCPDKSVVKKQGAGAGLISTPKLAEEIIESAGRGLKDWAEGVSLNKLSIPPEYLKLAGRNDKKERKLIPLSVKTRVGVETDEVSEWIARLMERPELSAVILHGRTLKQAYTGQANWELIRKAGEVGKKAGKVVVGNGDVSSYEDGVNKARKYGVDGVLIGRASQGNPWVFDREVRQVGKEEKLAVMLEQVEYFSSNFPQAHYDTQKKHLSWYCRGFAGAKNLRMKLMQAENVGEIKKLVL